MNRPVMYIIANKGLGMSPGKLAAQVAHAAARSARREDQRVWDEYVAKGETKIVLAARDNDHMLWADAYLAYVGILRMCLVIDEGHTEIEPLQPTALASPILDKEDESTKFAFSSFKLYKPDPPAPSPEWGFWGKRRRKPS